MLASPMLLGGGVGEFSMSFIEGNSFTGSGTTIQTISSQNFGSAAANRLLVFTVGWNGSTDNSTLTAATVGGSSATIMSGGPVNQSNATKRHADMFWIEDSSLTSGDVVLTFSSSLTAFGSDLGLAVYHVLNYGSATPAQTAINSALTPSTVPAAVISSHVAENSTLLNLTKDFEVSTRCHHEACSNFDETGVSHDQTFSTAGHKLAVWNGA